MFKNYVYFSFLIMFSFFACDNNESSSSINISNAITPDPVGKEIPQMECGTPIGNIFYVDPNGDDNGAGSNNDPWKTLAKGSQNLKPGETLYLRGEFEEELIINVSGSATAPITIKSDPESNNATLNGENIELSSRGLIQIEGQNYIKLCNLIIRNSKNHGVSVRHTWDRETSHIGIFGLEVLYSQNAAIHVYKSSYVVISDNYTKESITSGIGVWSSTQVAVLGNEIVNARNDDDLGHEEWISIADVSDFEVAYNELYMFEADFDGHSAIDVKESSYRGSVHHNYIHDFNKSGQIYIDAWKAGEDGSFTLSYIDVYSNYLENAKGITIGSEQGGIVEHINVFNNIIMNSYSSGILISETGDGNGGNGPRKNIHIFNNTIWGTRNHGTSSIYILSKNIENILIENNIVVMPPERVVGLITAGYPEVVGSVILNNNLSMGPNECANDHENCVELSNEINNLTGDPLFVDPENGDFNLSLLSPAIDGGIVINNLVNDFYDNPRPLGSGFDIGAVESF
jgi:Right handed beta helix region